MPQTRIPKTQLDVSLSDTSGTNTGDETQASIKTKLGAQYNSLYFVRESFIATYGTFTARTATGTGAAITLTNSSSPVGWFGTLTGTPGSTTTGFSGARMESADWMGKGSGNTTLEFKFKLDNLSDVTDTYTFRIGWLDTVGGESSSGIYLRYTDAVNGGRFEFVTRRAGVETATDTGLTVVAGTEYTALISVNSALTSVTATIDNVLRATNTTNIVSKSFGCGAGVSMVKSSGTTTRRWHVDYFEMIIP